MKRLAFSLLALCVLAAPSSAARKDKKAAEAEDEPKALFDSALLSGLAFREIGPAIASGRISDIAVHPERHSTWYVTVASGGVWKTVNAGTTWKPIFDSAGSYSVGCITLDLNDPLTIWVGTGENNSQRSVSYGDGVYKSTDGGASWTNVGLGESEHIGRIVVDPRDSDVVYVASQGPLWRAGGDRGLYKTTDGGESWERILHVDEHTGANEVWMDPRDPDVLYVSTYQRRRRTWTLINGGPGSGIHKSTDGGETWTELTKGLPKEDKGKIGLAISPVDPDVVYAIVESLPGKQGTYRSTDAGANWEKRSSYTAGSGQYYNELIPDPHDVDRVYSMDTWLHVTEDGGKTFTQVPETAKHVDNHALWIDPGDADHLVAGCDGGVYETWDRGATWDFKENLPITQFYKIAADNALPFYNVYGGTQDNSTLGGPSRTTYEHGISNREWYVTTGGDGFEPAVDPENPNIVYSQAQYGNIVRLDRATGELVDIKPQTEPGEDPPRWNWDSAFMISPHSPSRLYFASQRLYRSEDRGNSWRSISGDLTRNLDRNKLPVMGRVWGIDTVAKNRSTSFFGTVVSVTESPLVEDLIYAGTDDGHVQVTEDGGESWRKIDTFPGVPDMAYVSDLEASRHDADTVYATIDNHKSGDFLPYVLKSTDRGATWTSIASDLPENGSVHTLVEDPEVASLLFVGTEYGVFATVNGGGGWVQMKAGIPPIAVRDLVIQEREGDLIAGTFGRGFFVLDDYSPLRAMSEASLGEEAQLFAPRKTWMFMKSRPLGYNKKSFMGDAFYTAPNPPIGAVVTYYLKDGLKSLEEQRQEAEKERGKDGGDIGYPSWEELRAEDRAEDPAVLLTIRDSEGHVIRRLEGPVKKGLHRVTWDLRFPPPGPTSLTPRREHAFSRRPVGPMVLPGTYSVSLAKREGGEITELAGSVDFETVPIGHHSLPVGDRAEALAFHRKAAKLQRAAQAASRVMNEVQTRIDHLRKAAMDTEAGDPAWLDRLEAIETSLNDLEVTMRGDRTISSRNEPVAPSVLGRLNRVIGRAWRSSSAPTATQVRGYEIAAEAFGPVLDSLRRLVEEDLEGLEAEMERAGAPWTPGRIPVWEP